MDIVLPVGTTFVDPNNDINKQSSALPVLSVGIRAGNGSTPVGYAQSISRSHSRKVEAVYQLEPYVSGTFDQDTGANASPEIGPGNTFWPGERIEIVPGVIDSEGVKLTRTRLYTSTLFEALMRLHSTSSSNNRPDIRTTNFVTLTQQTRPFQIFEVYVSPVDGRVFFGMQYIDCFAKDMPHNVDVQKTSIVDEMNFEVTRVRLFTT